MYASSETFVVIGGGQAGAWIGRTLRAFYRQSSRQ